jgi:hypothetical protein
MKVAQGKVHKYLGMTLDFAIPKIVKVSMIKHVEKSSKLGVRLAASLTMASRQ